MQVLIVLVVLLHVSRIHGIPQILFESDSNESRNVNSGTSNLGGDKIPNPGSSDGKSGNGDSLRWVWVFWPFSIRNIRFPFKFQQFVNLHSRALCPTLAEHLFPYYRHDRVSGKCYRGGDRGPCGKNMIFYSEENSHGACDCDYRNQDRELVFHADSSQCHFVYSQVKLITMIMINDRQRKNRYWYLVLPYKFKRVIVQKRNGWSSMSLVNPHVPWTRVTDFRDLTELWNSYRLKESVYRWDQNAETARWLALCVGNSCPRAQ